MTYICKDCGWKCDADFIRLVWKVVEKMEPPSPLHCNFCGEEMSLEV